MMPSLPIPSEQDWGDYQSDPDQKYAHKIFFGKSWDESIPDFERNAIERIDELRFMPLRPFRYYMLALRNYVMSKHVLKNVMASDAASGFLDLVLEKMQEAPDAIAPIMEELMPALEYVAANQSLFDADVDIYGDFRNKLAEIKNLMNARNSQ